MNIPKGYKLVPVEPTYDMVIAFAETWYSKRQAYDDPDMDDAYRDMLAAAPTPPQPIYDEAAELEKFSAHWKLEGRIYRDKNTKQWPPTRDSIEGFQMAERVHALWLGWESCAQYRAKAVEVGDE